MVTLVFLEFSGAANLFAHQMAKRFFLLVGKELLRVQMQTILLLRLCMTIPMQTFTIATSNVVGARNTEAEVRAAVFKNINFATATAGSDVTGISSATADLNTVATTAAHKLRIIGVQDDPENSDFTVAGIPLIVRLNTSFNSANGGIASGTVSSTGV